MKGKNEQSSLRAKRSNLKANRIATAIAWLRNDGGVWLLFLVITLFFFYPIFKGHIPFPGDNLVGNYAPYNAYSHLGYAPGGVPNKAQGPDVIREVFPWKAFVIESLKHGQIPFWNPHNFSGNPLMANFQSAVFSPFNIILLVLPFTVAWAPFIFIAPFLAALFTYLFLRELKLSRISSILGGAVFAFSSYMVVWLEYGNITHTFLWLPLALLFTEKLTRDFTKRTILFLVLTLLASLLSGYIQGYFYILVTTFLYFVAKMLKNRRLPIKKTFFFCLSLSIPTLLFLFQILSTLTLFQSSTRGAYTLDQFHYLLNPLWYAITVIIPDFFGNPASRNYWFDGTYIERVSYFGVIPFILALAALVSIKKNKELKIFSALFVLTFLITLDLLFTPYIYMLPLPMLSTTVPTRLLGLFQFFGAILAAFSLEYLLQKKNKKEILILSIAVAGIIASAFAFTFFAEKVFPNSEWTINMNVARRNSILPLFLSVIFAALVFIRFYGHKFFFLDSRLRGNDKKVRNGQNINDNFFYIIILVLTIGELFYFFHKITPFSPKEFIYPQTPVVTYLQKNAGVYRYWGYGSGYIHPNFQTYDKTFSPEGDDPLHVRWYTEFLEGSKDGKLPKAVPRPDANVASGYGPEGMDGNLYRQKVLNLVGVKYIVNKDDSLGKEYRHITGSFNPERYKLVWQEAPWQVYENRSVVPRVFLTNDYVVIKDKEKIIQEFFKPGFDGKKTIILEIDPKLAKSEKRKAKSEAKINSYTANNVVITTNSSTEALLFLSDTYYPEWKADIDGKETKIYRANYAFRAVVVPAGEHTVTFYYDSEAFKKGLWLSVGFALTLVLLFWKMRIRNK